MLVVIAIGLIIINQVLELSYKYILLTDPCQLCDAYLKHQSHGFNLNLSDLNLSEWVVQNLTNQ